MELLELHEMKIVDFDEIEKLFNNSNKSIFRLELLQTYSVDYEIDNFNNFLHGEEAPSDIMDDWIEILRNANARGVYFGRVRLIKKPLTKYTKYEIAWGYKFSRIGGEDIRIIFDNKWPLFKTEVPYLMDYWMFDDARGFLMYYDMLGKYIGVSEIPYNYIKYYVKLKEEALEMSVDILDTGLIR